MTFWRTGSSCALAAQASRAAAPACRYVLRVAPGVCTRNRWPIPRDPAGIPRAWLWPTFDAQHPRGLGGRSHTAPPVSRDVRLRAGVDSDQWECSRATSKSYIARQHRAGPGVPAEWKSAAGGGREEDRSARCRIRRWTHDPPVSSIFPLTALPLTVMACCGNPLCRSRKPPRSDHVDRVETADAVSLWKRAIISWQT